MITPIPPTETKPATAEPTNSVLLEPIAASIAEADDPDDLDDIEPNRTIGSILGSIFIGTMFFASAVMIVFSAYAVWILVQPQTDLSRPAVIEPDEQPE